MDISVLLSTFKRPALLEQTLRSFCSLTADGMEWEVLVVDNVDDPATQEVLRRFSTKIPLKPIIELTRGKNNALNRAIPEARGELLIFTDDDVLAEPQWLVEIREGAQRWPHHHVFGGRCLPKFPDGFAPSFDHPFFENAFTIANWAIPEGVYEAGKVWGPNMALRASIFKAGWRFDPGIGPDGTNNYRMGSETEFTTRLEKNGFAAIYLPRSIVYHQVRMEQMNAKWLYGRAFRAGREEACIQDITNLPMVGKIPRYLIRRVCKEFLYYTLSRLSRDKKVRFDRAVSYWQTRGMVYQYRKECSKILANVVTHRSRRETTCLK